jgi:hypothetical protein
MTFVRRAAYALVLTAGLSVFGAAHADPKADILAAHAHLVKAGKFRMQSTTVADGQTMKSSATILWPDRFHVVSANGEFIILPGTSYMKQGGNWMPLPMNMGAMIQAMSPDAMKQGYDNMTNIRELPAEDLAGVATRVYEYDTSATIMGIRADSHVTVWIATDDGRLVKQKSTGKAMGKSSVSESLYEFDPAIDVKAPM